MAVPVTHYRSANVIIIKIIITTKHITYWRIEISDTFLNILNQKVNRSVIQHYCGCCVSRDKHGNNKVKCSKIKFSLKSSRWGLGIIYRAILYCNVNVPYKKKGFIQTIVTLSLIYSIL